MEGEAVEVEEVGDAPPICEAQLVEKLKGGPLLETPPLLAVRVLPRASGLTLRATGWRWLLPAK